MALYMAYHLPQFLFLNFCLCYFKTVFLYKKFLCVLIFFYLKGKITERRIKRSSIQSLTLLLALGPEDGPDTRGKPEATSRSLTLVPGYNSVAYSVLP